MPDLSEVLRQSVAAESAAYEPSGGLPQRIARRTLQLQRRRRGRIVGGAAFLAVGILAVPVLLPSRGRLNSVGVAYDAAPATAQRVKASGTTTTTTAAAPILDLQAFIDNGIKERNKALKRFAAALTKVRAREAAKARSAAEVLGETETRGSANANPSTGDSTGTTKGSSSSTKPRATTTTRRSTTTTTRPPVTTTTTNTPPPTTPTTPIVPLQIVAPAVVCAGVPAVFQATGTGAELMIWSNLEIGATATYLFTESTTISALINIPGSYFSQSFNVLVTPTGTPPC